MAMLRVLWLLLLLLCVIVGWVACCKDNLECSLNGKCDTRTAKCICERGWTGSDCSTLNLLPPANNTGYVPANGSSSWGGSVVKGHDGKYHMFVSQFANKCGCDVWYPNSQIVHTISDRNMSSFPSPPPTPISHSFRLLHSLLSCHITSPTGSVSLS
jgi:hypothetical protein